MGGSTVPSKEEEGALLTSRERDILNGLAGGNSYRKLHVHSQSEAVAKALRKGII